jgi:hypothetical protein
MINNVYIRVFLSSCQVIKIMVKYK